ncbi:MAG: TolC family outer membrane protein, partial [Gammaproteobacteria bacterium]|nr:TolC family outer membrane protein [Gammaproteobacteria bacterium]
MKKLLIAIGFLVVLLIAPIASADDLLEIYQLALRSDPSIREAEANREATLQTRPQARGFLLPQIAADATWIDQATEGERTTTFGLDTRTTAIDSDIDGVRWGVQLTQTLFRWDQWVTLKKAGKQVAQAEADYLTAQQDLIIRVASSYFDVLAAKNTLESEQAAKEAIARQLEQAKKRFEVGLIAITDVQEAQSGYDQAVAAEILAKRNLATRKEVLREIVGEYQTNLIAPKAIIPLVSPNPEDEDAWVKTAAQRNPAVLSAELGAEIASTDKRIAKTGHYPTIDFVAGYRDTDFTGTTLTTTGKGPQGTDTEDTSIEVRFQVPIFSGGTTSARVREAVYRQRAARERFERAIRQNERETRDAYLGVVSEIARVKALKQALASSETALQATEAGFDVGTRTT